MADAIPSETKLCSTCGEPIPLVAKKCTHCETFQDWRRNISFSSTILALLTALISVFSLSLPIFVNAFRYENARLAATFGGVGGSNDNLIFLVTNSGTRPGAFISAAFRYFLNHQIQVDVPLRVLGGTLFVEPGKGAEFLLGTEANNFRGPPAGYFDYKNEEAECVMKITTADFLGVLNEKESLFPCIMILPFVLKIAPAAVRPMA